MPSAAHTPDTPEPAEAAGTAGRSWLPWRSPWWPFTGKETSGEPDSAEMAGREDGTGQTTGTGQEAGSAEEKRTGHEDRAGQVGLPEDPGPPSSPDASPESGPGHEDRAGQVGPPEDPGPPPSPDPSPGSGPGRDAPGPEERDADPQEVFARAQAEAAAAFAAVEARAGEWDRLVMVCVDLADRLRVHDAGLFAVLRSGLEEVGVTLAEVDGERFDRKRHRAVGREPTGEPGRHMTVAHTQLCGVTDRDRQVRLPAVVVYVEAGEGNGG
ncbi:hypothetical protein GCM10009677_00580 [Sphaerisporangium rubeum]